MDGIIENMAWTFQVELLTLEWDFKRQILSGGNLDDPSGSYISSEDLSCWLVTDSDTVFEFSYHMLFWS